MCSLSNTQFTGSEILTLLLFSFKYSYLIFDSWTLKPYLKIEALLWEVKDKVPINNVVVMENNFQYKPMVTTEMQNFFQVKP